MPAFTGAFAGLPSALVDAAFASVVLANFELEADRFGLASVVLRFYSSFYAFVDDALTPAALVVDRLAEAAVLVGFGCETGPFVGFISVVCKSLLMPDDDAGFF